MLDSSLMQLMWLASPALPIGGFSYSEVLESAVDKSMVANESNAREWLLDQLHQSLARSDLAVLIPAAVDHALAFGLGAVSLICQATGQGFVGIDQTNPI